MNREIKFRMFEKATNLMYYENNEIIFGLLCAWSDKYELMQYTGLKDKNGKGIYEGDIVSFFIGSETHENSRFEIKEVFWYDDEAGFFVGSKSKMIRPTEISSLIDDIEVIGNIYENPELLENDQDR